MSRKIDLESVLTVNSSYARHALKRRLVEEGMLDYRCQICSNDGMWNGQKLSLQLDHVNGVFNDNRLENLRFLCPNCHSQTDSYAGKNIIGKTNKGTAKADYRIRKREKDKELWAEILNDDSVQLGKRGWVSRVANRIGISPQKVNKWIKRVDNLSYLKYYAGE